MVSLLSLIKPIIAVSSANLIRGQEGSLDLQSEVYRVNKNGARTVPWGAPVLDWRQWDNVLLLVILTYWERSVLMKWNISNQFWTYIFLILPNSIQRSFSIVLENDIMQRTLEDIYHLSRVWVKKKKEYHTKENKLIYTYSKNHRIPGFYSGDIAKYVTLPQSRIGQFIHLTTLFYRQWTKCIVFMLMP